MGDLLVGLLTAIIGWVVVTIMLRPRLSWQKDLHRFDAEPGAAWHDAYVRNRMPWKAVDVTLMARLRARGVYPNHPRRWATFDLPVDDPSVPRLRGTLTSRRTGVSRWKTIRTGSARHRIRILMEDLPDRLVAVLPPEASVGSDIERLLSAGTEAELYFVAFATDGVSGTRSEFESMRYTRSGWRD